MTGGGEHSVQLHCETVFPVARLGHVARFGVGLLVRGQDGGHGGVEVVRGDEESEPLVDGGEDAFFADHGGEWVSGDRRRGVVGPTASLRRPAASSSHSLG